MTICNRTVPFLDLSPTTDEIRSEVGKGWQLLLDSNVWVGGAAVEEFEQRWANYCGTEHAVAVGNGTDALHLILRALGIGRGDEVLVPANTFVATAEAVVLAGARPRFVDVHPDNLSLSADAVEAAITPSTAAVIPVHLYGHVADLPALADVSRRHGIAMIEDAAQAHGATRDGVPAGSVGTASAFSFYPGKNLGAFGDGGAVTTDDAHLAATIRSLGNHGRAPDGRYDHPIVGTNSRLDALQAVVLTAKLARLDAWNECRRDIVRAYRERLGDLPLRLVEPDAGVTSSWHLLVARVAERDRVREELAHLGVHTGIHYPIPCPEQEPFAASSNGTCPVASRTAREIVSLPLHPHMDLDEVEVVCDALSAVLTQGPR
ncbi:MAG TPA: DegT/DnrJ/EryC1/StrS family aminotransferase [Blastococcus sp.]|nr:DegT/DnrJ/EryC1/StrS family aminotransferase [Blastococcus sp.]